MKDQVINLHKNEKGQVLVFVIVMMTIALGIGVAVSMQTLRSISTVTDADSSQISLAAAEGAAERVLRLSPTEIAQVISDFQSACNSNLIDGTFSNNKCLVTFSDTSGEVTTVGALTVSTYTTNTPNGSLEFNISLNDMYPINLSGYGTNNLDLCWTGSALIEYTLYDASYNESKKLLTCTNDSCSGSMMVSGAITADSGASHGHAQLENCYTVSMPFTPMGMRIRAIGNPIQGEVFPAGTLPNQGYKITSEGYVQNSPDIKRLVEIYKSYPYLPGIFDFSLYAQNGVL